MPPADRRVDNDQVFLADASAAATSPEGNMVVEKKGILVDLQPAGTARLTPNKTVP